MTLPTGYIGRKLLSLKPKLKLQLDDMFQMWVEEPIADANYYVSPTGDNTDGLTPETAFQTIADLNGTVYVAGDVIAFENDYEYFGELALNQSGASGNHITFTSYYQSGAKPKISGFETIAGWVDEGGGIYSKVIVSEDKANAVSVDGNNQKMGRYPNSSDLTYETFSGTTSITDSSLTNTPNWTGGEAVIRKADWILKTCTITDHTDDTITYTDVNGSYTPSGPNVYFIQSHINTLTTYGDWYHDYSGTGKFYMYFGGVDPNTVEVKVSTLNNLVDFGNESYVTFDNIAFEGSISHAWYSFGYIGTALNASNCSFEKLGGCAMYQEGNIDCIIDNNTFTDCVDGIYTNECGGYVVINNTFTNIGMIAGSERAEAGYNAIYYIQKYLEWQPQNALFQYNTFTNIGYNGIKIFGTDTVVTNNKFDGVCLVNTDGGAIYGSGSTSERRLFTDNIVLNSGSEGIYLDDDTQGATVTGNTVAHCATGGVKNHWAENNIISNNTVFDTQRGITPQNYYSGVVHIQNMNIQNNIVVAKSGQSVFYFWSTTNGEIAGSGIINNNIYSRPIDNGNAFFYNQPSTGNVNTNLAGWQSFSGLDALSTDPGYTISSDDDFVFEYNATSTSVNITISEPMKDFEGNLYSAGSVSIPAWSSLILIPQ